MTKAALTYPVPETPEQEAALEKALATRVLQKLDAAKALFASDGYTAFRADLEALVELKLPAASATAQNAANLRRFLDTMSQGVDQDVKAADAAANPMAPIAPLTGVPVVAPPA